MGNFLAIALSALVLAPCSLLLAPCPVHAQQPKKVPRVGYISTLDTGGEPRFEGIRQRLRELGYIEGQNIIIEHYRSGGRDLDRYQKTAEEIVRSKVDVIVVGGGTTYVKVVTKATQTIPIVMSGPGGDPVEAGLIKSLARPGGNVTGLTILARDLGGKRLELLKEIAPKVVHVAILYDPDNPSHRYERKEVLPATALALKLTLQPWEVRDSKSFDRVFDSMTKQVLGALYGLGSALMIANQKRIDDFALRNRLPSTGGSRGSVGTGELFYYGADLADSYGRIALYIDKILKGAKPGDLPVEQPTKFEFVINQKTAKQIGINIPNDVLARATKIIR